MKAFSIVLVCLLGMQTLLNAQQSNLMPDADGARITSVEILGQRDMNPIRISPAGGTRLIIRGSGFDAKCNNIVWIGNTQCTTAGLPCSPTAIMCQTTAVSNTVLFSTNVVQQVIGSGSSSQVVFDGTPSITVDIASKDIAQCLPNVCNVHYTTYGMPNIVDLSSRTVKPGDTLDVIGNHRVGNSTTKRLGGGEFAQLTVGTIKLTPKNTDIEPSSTTPFAIKYDIPQKLEAGFYKIDQRTNMGLAKKSSVISPVRTSGGLVDDLVVVPTITSVTPDKAGYGGTDITIAGLGYGNDSSAVSVKVSGASCSINSISYNEIRCRVAAVDSASVAASGQLSQNSSLTTRLSPYSSGPGIDFKVYDTSSLVNKTVDGLRKSIIWGPQLTTTSSGANLNFKFQDTIARSQARTYSGYLKVPITGSYVFRAQFVGSFSFFLSNVKGSAEIPDYCAPLIAGESQAYSTVTVPTNPLGARLSSSSVSLTEGDYIYYEAYYFTNNVNPGFLSMSMDVTPTTSLSGGVQKYEVQTIRVAPSTITPQVIQFIQEGGAVGTYLMRLIITENGQVRSDTNETLQWNATASQFQAALLRFEPFKDYNPTVTLQTFDNDNLPQNTTGKAVFRHVYSVSILRTRTEAHRNMRFTFVNRMNSSAVTTAIRILEVEVRQNHSPPVSGTFRLSYNSNPVLLSPSNTNDISIVRLDLNELRHAIAKVSDCPDLVITRETDIRPEDGLFLTVSWNGCPGDKSPLTVGVSNLTGGASGSPTIAISTLSNGAVGTKTFEPIPLDFLYTARGKGQVVVTVNNVDSFCNLENDCDYVIKSTAPVIDSHSWTSSSGAYTATMVANAGLASVTSVTVGGKGCTPLSFDTSTKVLTCNVQKTATGIDLPAGSYTPNIMFNGENGYAVRKSGVAQLPLTANITGYNLLVGPQNGGVELIIQGNHLPTSTTGLTVKYCNSTKVKIISARSNQIKIVTEPCVNTTATVSVIPSGGSEITYSSVFNCNQVVSLPTITLAQTTTALYYETKTIEINGVDFSTTLANSKVQVITDTVSRDVLGEFTPSAATATKLTVTINKVFAPGSYIIRVKHSTTGYAANTFAYVVTEPSLTGVTVSTLNINGGTTLSINGTSLSPYIGDHKVIIKSGALVDADYIRQGDCNVTAASATLITCTTVPISQITETGATAYNVYVIYAGRYSIPASTRPTVTFPAANTISVTNMASLKLLRTNQTYSIEGTGFKPASTNPTVKIGIVDATVSASTNTQISFTIPATIAAGVYEVTVSNSDGLTAKKWLTEVDLTLASSPFTISTTGFYGNEYCLLGTNLPNPSSVYFHFETTGPFLSADPGTFSANTKTCFRVLHGTPFSTDQIKFDVLFRYKNRVWTYTTTAVANKTVALTVTSASIAAGATTGPTFTLSTAAATITVVYAEFDSNNRRISSWTTLQSGDFTITGAAITLASAIVQSLPGGRYGLVVYINDSGSTNIGFFTVTWNTTAPTSTALTTSYVGGQTFAVTGTGLPNKPLVVAGISVPVDSSSGSTRNYKLPAYFWPDVGSTVRNIVPRSNISIPIKQITIDTDLLKKDILNDGKILTEYRSRNDQCSIDIEFSTTAIPTHVRFFIPMDVMNPALIYDGMTFQARSESNSADRTISQEGFVFQNGWNVLTVSELTDNYYKFLKISHTDKSGCRLSQVQLYGYPKGTVAPTDDILDVVSTGTISDGIGNTHTTASITYKWVDTPFVTSMSPIVGRWSGDTEITIRGFNFGIVMADVSIKINDKVCTVTSTTATQIKCNTTTLGAAPTGNPTFEMKVKENIAVINCQPFVYAELWSESVTWGSKGTAPQSGDSVFIPLGKTVHFDATSTELKDLVVEGTLIFAGSSDVDIKANSVVINGGTFRVGGVNATFDNNFKLTLGGKRVDGAGIQKAIVCNSCNLHVYGKKQGNPTTTIFATTAASDTNIATSTSTISSLGWVNDEQIVVAPTGNDPAQFEYRHIATPNSTHLNFCWALANARPTRDLTNSNNASIKTGIEFGNLVRKVKIVGDDQSKTSGYGLTIEVNGQMAELGRSVVLDNVQIYNCGKGFIKDGHCIHFKNNGDLSGSYIGGSSIYNSTNRMITVTRGSALQIRDNIGAMITGHGIVLPTGSEVDNVIRNNLIVGVAKPDTTYNNDGPAETLSAIIITNPRNSLTLNVIAGVDGNGVLYDLKERSEGIFGDDFCPSGMRVTAFSDNIIHTIAETALIVKNMVPRSKPCLPPRDLSKANIWETNPPIATELKNLTIYGAKAGVVLDNIGSVSIVNSKIADSKNTALELKETINSKDFIKIKDTAFFGKIIITSITNSDTTFIRTSQNNGLELDNIRFATPVPNMVAIRNCDACRQPIIFSTDFKTHQFTTMHDSGVTVKMIAWGNKKGIVHDLTGKFTSWYFDGAGDRTSTVLMPHAPHLQLKGECINATSSVITTAWDTSILCSTGTSARFVTIARANTKDIRDRYLNNPIRVSRIDSTIKNLCNNFTNIPGENERWDVPVLVGKTYNLTWVGLADFKNFSIIPSSYRKITSPENAVILRFPFRDPREMFEVRKINADRSSVQVVETTAPLVVSTCNFGDYYVNPAEKTIDICYRDVGISNVVELSVSSIDCRMMCDVPAANEKFTRIWSNATQWPGGVLPTASSTVTVPATWTLIVDTNSVSVTKLKVDGRLFFRNIPITFEAKNIEISQSGAFIVGNATHPFTSAFTLNLNGANTSETQTVSGVTLPKSIIVAGRMEFNGVPPRTVWTRLASRLSSSSLTFKVDSGLDWAATHQVVVGPTGFDRTEGELCTINSVSASRTFVAASAVASHFGEPDVTILSQYGNIDTRAAVGHVTRNIQIKQTGNNTFGFAVYVTGTGILIARGVRFHEGGQEASSRAALTFEGKTQTTPSVIEGCSFTTCSGMCLSVSNSSNININNNVFFSGRKYIVKANSVTSYNFNSNLMIGAKKSTALQGSNAAGSAIPLVNRYSGTTSITLADNDDVACYAHTSVTSYNTISVRDNLCQGSILQGFVFPFPTCTNLRSYTLNGFRRNQASSCDIGFVSWNPAPTACVGLAELIASHNNIALLANPHNVGTVNYEDFLLTDNKRGVTLMNGFSDQFKNIFEVKRMYISAVGRRNCSYCYSNASECSNYVGIRLPISTEYGREYPTFYGNSIQSINGVGAYDSKAYVSNIEFANFRDTFETAYSNNAYRNCANNVLFGINTASTDMIGNLYVSQSFCRNCTAASTILARAPTALVNETECNSSSTLSACTGPTNYYISDADGNLTTFTSMYAPQLSGMVNNDTSVCTTFGTTNLFRCNPTLTMLQYDGTNGTEINATKAFPISLTWGANKVSSANAMKMWPGSISQIPRIITLVLLSNTYSMAFPIQPQNIWYRLQKRDISNTGSNAEWIIISTTLLQDVNVRLFNMQNEITPLMASDSTNLTTLSSRCGSHRYNSTSRVLEFVLTASNLCAVKINFTSSLKINTTLSMDYTAFMQNSAANIQEFITKMAAFLKINASRIVIKDVRNGSTIISYDVLSDPAAGSNMTSIGNEFTSISNLLQSTPQGNINLGSLGPVISSSSQMVNVVAPDGQVYNSYVPPASNNDPPLKDQTTTIVLATVIPIVGIIGIAVVVYFIVKKVQAANAQIGANMEPLDNQPGSPSYVTENNKIQLNANSDVLPDKGPQVADPIVINI